MHLHDLLNMPISDYEVERQKVETLFEHKGFYYCSAFYHSLKDFLNRYFLGSRLQGTSLDISDFFATHSKKWDSPSLENLLLYCEVVYNFIAEFYDHIKTADSADYLAGQILHNISIILDKTGYEIKKTGDNLFEIVKKDALASAAIADLQDRDVAFAVFDYLHFGIKGKISQKRELLVRIGRYIEPLLKDARLKGSQVELVKDIGFCLNNLNIRHNNKEGKNAKSFVESMPPAEMEEWYDKAYRSMLLLIEQAKQLETHAAIEGLRTEARGERGKHGAAEQELDA